MVILIDLPLFDSYLVDTPAEYEHFRKGLYYVFNDIFVEAGAHPDVLSQAQHAFSNTRNNHILFRDERGDYIYLTPRKLFVNANFTQGNLFAKLPTNYKSYVISVTDDSVITEADNLAIAQWHSATDVRITKKSDE